MKTLSKREGLAITDCAFMCSRDGRNFKRYDEAFFKAGPEYGYNWVYGDCYPAKGFLTTKSKFAVVSNLCVEKYKIYSLMYVQYVICGVLL